MPDQTPLDIRTQDLDTLEVDARRALIRDRPGTDAIWLALLKPRNRVLRRWREALDQMTPRAAAAIQEPNTPLLGPDGNALVGPLGQLIEPVDDGPPGLISVGDAIVAKAMLGDMTAAEMILNRIEGRVGSRKDDEDADAVNRRGEIIIAIEETVRKLQEQPGDHAVDVTPPKAKNGSGVTDLDVEDTVKKFYQDDGKPNGKTPKKPGGSGFTS